MKKPVPKVIKVKKTPLEKDSERRLFLGVRQRGGQCYKFSSIQRRGVSDRVVIIYGFVIFVEMKRQGVTQLSKKQEDFREDVEGCFNWFCTVSGHDGVDQFLAYVDSRKTIMWEINKWVRTIFPLFNSKIFK